MALGIIGLFVGAIVLSVGYKLFLSWISEGGAALEMEDGVRVKPFSKP